jgi:hypothetical protein
VHGSRTRYESLGPQAAKERPIPWIVWAALLATLLSGGIIIGLVLGIVARRQIKSSDGRLGGLAMANVAIALNVVPLIYILVVIVPHSGRRCRPGRTVSAGPECSRNIREHWRMRECSLRVSRSQVPGRWLAAAVGLLFGVVEQIQLPWRSPLGGK